MKLCRSFRAKALADVVFRDEAALVAAFSRNDDACTCLRTLRTWGPDDAPVVPELCQPGRACFVLSPRSPTAGAPLA